MFLCFSPYLVAFVAEQIGLHMKLSPFWLVNQQKSKSSAGFHEMLNKLNNNII